MNESVYKSIISTIKRTRIPDRSISKKTEGLLLHSWSLPCIPFGNFKIEDIDEITINDYIEMRLKTPTKQTEKKEVKKLVSKTTVKREMTILSRFFDKLRYLDNVKFKKFSFNPVLHHDKDLLEGHKKYRIKRFEEDELERLVFTLNEARNKEMLLIFLLSLSTGLRRSEVVTLRWDQITGKTINLGKTKNGMPRSVVLLQEAKEILEKVPRIDERLFHYSISGFSTNWKRAIKKSGVIDVKFHDCRKEFISTILSSISNSSVVVAELTGSVDPDYLEKTYIKENSLDSEKGLMNSVGHGSKSMLKRYAKIVNS